MSLSLYKVAKWFMLPTGLWKIPVTKSTSIQKMYSIYSVSIQCLYVLYNISLAIRLYELFGELEMSELYTYITLVILILEINYKILTYIRNGIPYMFWDVIEREEAILQNQDKTIFSIYSKQVKYYKFATFCQCFCSGIGITWFTIISVYRKYALGTKEHFMYELWFPFNKEEHDIIVTATNIILALYGFLFNCASQTPLQTLMVSSATHLRILQLHLRHCFKSRSLSDEKKVKYVKKLIKEHQFLINFITDLNNAIKSIILVEFALQSINGAGALLQIVSMKNVIEIPYSTIYLLSLIINLSTVAWSASEIIVQSKNVANAIYEGDWLDQPKEVKSMLLIMLMRAQKQLSIDVGPFRPMDMEAALITMKGSYTYASVMMQMRSN